MFEESVDHSEDPPFHESVTTELWRPEETDCTAEVNRRVDMTVSGYSGADTNPSPPVSKQKEFDDKYEAARHYVSMG